MRLAIEIARRLSLGNNAGSKKSLAVKVATVSVAISIAVMLLTLAVTSGFQSAIKNKIAGFEAQITLTPLESSEYGYRMSTEGIELNEAINSIIRQVAPEAEVSVALRFEAMLKTPDNFSAIQLRSYAPDHDTSFLQSMITSGNPEAVDSLFMADGDPMLILSEEVASELQLKPGDKVNTVFFDGNKIKVRNPQVAATYNSHFSTYDRNIAYASKSMLDGIALTSLNEGNAIELRNIDFNSLTDKTLELQSAFDQYYLQQRSLGNEETELLSVSSIIETAAHYFNWLALLDTNVVVMIVLMALITLFTLVATLFIIILERTRLIGLLKTLGSPNRLIRHVFIFLIGRIALIGLVVGNIITIGIVAVQSATHIIPLNPESYFLNYVPMNLSVVTLIIVNAAAIVVILAAMLLPSLIIGRISPAQTVRYE
ncbi:MAG: FtsX-like permease family protein [Muribaculaceae bacterium]|nr:FtsX-like permease family protein [Muribaculaceae bacterium]